MAAGEQAIHSSHGSAVPLLNGPVGQQPNGLLANGHADGPVPQPAQHSAQASDVLPELQPGLRGQAQIVTSAEHAAANSATDSRDTAEAAGDLEQFELLLNQVLPLSISLSSVLLAMHSAGKCADRQTCCLTVQVGGALLSLLSYRLCILLWPT